MVTIETSIAFILPFTFQNLILCKRIIIKTKLIRDMNRNERNSRDNLRLIFRIKAVFGLHHSGDNILRTFSLSLFLSLSLSVNTKYTELQNYRITLLFFLDETDEFKIFFVFRLISMLIKIILKQFRWLCSHESILCQQK